MPRPLSVRSGAGRAGRGRTVRVIPVSPVMGCTSDRPSGLSTPPRRLDMTASEYRLATDSCCDLTPAIVEELDLEVLEFPFTLDGAEHFDDLGVTMSAARFYDAMRAGSAPTTAQVPMSSYWRRSRRRRVGHPLMLPELLVGAFGHARAAVLIPRGTRAVPGARLRVIDSRSASINQGLLVFDAARKLEAGWGTKRSSHGSKPASTGERVLHPRHPGAASPRRTRFRLCRACRSDARREAGAPRGRAW